MDTDQPRITLMRVAEDVPPIRLEERPICKAWLRSIDFLASEEDDMVWDAITAHWEQFLKETRTRFIGSGPSRRLVQTEQARLREAIKQGIWEGFDGIDAMAERWPAVACRALNQPIEGPDAAPFESLAARWLLERRRRYQSIWSSLVCFLAWGIGKTGVLEEMGLELDEEQTDDILDVVQDAGPGLFSNPAGLSASIQGVFLRAITDASATPRTNPLLWWMAVLVRSATSDDGPDYISRGRISMNILPLDVDIASRIEALGHYCKPLILQKAFLGWEAKDAYVIEVQDELNAVDNEWLNGVSGQRPDPGLDRRTCCSVAWKKMLEHLETEGMLWLGGRQRTVIYEVGRLLRDLRAAGLTR